MVERRKAPPLGPCLSAGRALCDQRARLRAGGFDQLADEWEQHCDTLGRDVVIRVGHRQVRGRAESLGDDGSLVVRTDHGHLESIVGGDVTLEK